MTLAHDDGRVQIHHGDCLDVLRGMPDCSVDSVVTDPPAGVSFMGRDWDHDKGGRDHWIAWLTEVLAECTRILKPGGHPIVWALPRTSGWTHRAIEDAGLDVRDCITHLFGSGFPKALDVSKAIDKQRDDYPQIRAVVEFIRAALAASGKTRADMEQALGGTAVADHFLKPSRSNAGCPQWDQWLILKDVLGFGDAMDAEVWRLNGRKGTPGHERDVIGVRWTRSANDLYGGGRGTNLETLDTAPATDEAKRWEGWATALKPASEFWYLARKPLDGTCAANVLRHGTGALNIGATRVTTDDNLVRPASYPGMLTRDYQAGLGKRPEGDPWGSEANPRQGVQPAGRWPANVVLSHPCQDECEPGCAVAELDRQSGVSKDGVAVRRNGVRQGDIAFGTVGKFDAGAADVTYGGEGGASRFFPVFRYQAKAPSRERPKVDGVAHPTVKPLSLMAWLCRLVTPPGGTILEPFAGSGTTVEAALMAGFRCVAIEREAEYLPLILARIERQAAQPEPVKAKAEQMGLFDDGDAA